MQFTRVIGKVDPDLVKKAEDKLTKIFLELGTRYDNDHIGSKLGGDSLIFTLMYPVQHVCTLSMPTAATDGRRFYWNPKFVLKQSLLGLRIICGHEAWHALYMHPARRGSRIPKLWNIAVDYIVNSMVMEDLKARKQAPREMFEKHLGKYWTLEEYANILKDPFKNLKGWQEEMADNATAIPLPSPNVDRDLTPEEQKELERREKKERFFFADENLEDDMKRPEKIYEYLYSLLPKCPKCGKIGYYKLPNKGGKKKSDKKDQQQAGGKDKQKDKSKGNQPGDQPQDDGDQPSDQNGNQPGDQPGDCCGNQPGQGQGKGCGCDGGMDIFGFGSMVDDHMDTEETQEKLAKRFSDAMESARKMAGHIPGALEDELGKLTAPKITWQDVIRTRIMKARVGNGKNDWTRFRSRPMFSGLLVPKRRSYYSHFGCLLDTSGSMSNEDMAYGLSQLQGLDERSEGTIVPNDCQVYWDKATKIKRANAEELLKVKVVGRGGTMFAPFFTDYEENIGKCDFLIVITDGYLCGSDIANMVNPGVDVFWVITSECDFIAPFGKVYKLRD